ncbi:MAG: hypothetical protein P8Y53_18710 [Pseudolabrys sp.]
MSTTAGATVAPPSEQVFQELGLFGTWASDCSAKPAPDNPYVKISQPAPGFILEDNDLGPDIEVNRYSVLSAHKLSGGKVAVQVIFQPGKENEQRQTLIWAVHDGTLRTLFNQPKDGPVRVKNGVAVGYGIATPVLKKCK